MNYLIVELVSYHGNDTSMEVNPSPLYMVIDCMTGKELDNGYVSIEQALEHWPEPVNKLWLVERR